MSAPGIGNLQTPKEAAKLLKVSVSWMAKARMRGDGPPYMKVGRCIRYADVACQPQKILMLSTMRAGYG